MNEKHGGGFGVGGPNPAGKYFIGSSYLKPLSKIEKTSNLKKAKLILQP